MNNTLVSLSLTATGVHMRGSTEQPNNNYLTIYNYLFMEHYYSLNIQEPEKVTEEKTPDRQTERYNVKLGSITMYNVAIKVRG